MGQKRGQHVVIVGAGPGGLAAAILLAKAGLQVTVLERHNHVGGRTSTLNEAGYKFDLGPTFFLYPRVLAKILAAAGRNLYRELDLVRLDPQYRLIFGGGGQIDATPNIPAMEAQIAAVPGVPAGDVAGFARFMDDNRAKLAAFRPVLEKAFLSWTDLLDWNVLASLPHIRPWASLDTELARYFRDERVRLAFTFQSKYLGMSPFVCPSLFSILSFLEYEHGVFHPIGGCGAVSAMMARLARDLGADIRLGEDVQSLDFDGARVTAARTPAGLYPADALIINADFAHAMTRLVPDELRHRWSDARLAHKKFSCSTFMIYLGIEGRYDDLAHHTIYLSEDYATNLREIDSDHILSTNPSFYVQNAGITDPTLAPPGHSTLYLLAPVSHQHANISWPAQAAAFRERLLDQTAKIGLCDLRHRIRHERVLTPDDWQTQHQIFRGATFNLAHGLDQMLHLRPRNRFEELQGVYLVGGGTHPGSGLPVIYESACITSRVLLNDWGQDTTWLDALTEPAPQYRLNTADAPCLSPAGPQGVPVAAARSVSACVPSVSPSSPALAPT